MKTTIKSIMLIAILLTGLTGKVFAGQCLDGSSSDNCCNVITAGNGHGSLKEHVKSFNFGSGEGENASWGACRELIDFKIPAVSAVHIEIAEPLEFLYENSSADNSLVIDGSGVILSSELENAEDSIFVINGTNNITLQ